MVGSAQSVSSMLFSSVRPWGQFAKLSLLPKAWKQRARLLNAIDFNCWLASASPRNNSENRQKEVKALLSISTVTKGATQLFGLQYQYHSRICSYAPSRSAQVSDVAKRAKLTLQRISNGNKSIPELR